MKQISHIHHNQRMQAKRQVVELTSGQGWGKTPWGEKETEEAHSNIWVIVQVGLLDLRFESIRDTIKQRMSSI